MKKLAKLLSVFLAACMMFGCGGSKEDKPYEGQTLHIYNWGEYIDEELISEFEDQTGCKVKYDLFDSNEAMYIKVANGEAYDLLMPSDYMIERLLQENLLQKLDKEKLTCMDELNKDVLGLPYDPNNDYSIPYFWGTVGIVYDKTKVSKEDLKKEGYNIFLNQKYKKDIFLYDSERDSFMMALKALGYSMNTSNEAEIEEAYQWLSNIVKTMEPEIVTDEVLDKMINGERALALVYSGDAAYVMAENENLGFYMPETGTNVWSDAMVIPANAKNPELAHEFINFISEYENALANSTFVGYTSPNTKAMEELAETDYEGINAYTPARENDKDEVFAYDEATRKILSDKWSKIKIEASNAKK